MKTGFTTVTFRKKSIEENVAIAVRAGVQGIEWGSDVHVTDQERARYAKKLTDEAGLSVLSYGAYFRCQDENADEQIPLLVENALILEAPIIRVWAGRAAPANITPEGREEIIRNARALCDAAAPHGIKVAFEYHRGTLTQDIDSAIALLKDIDRPNMKCYWQPNPDISFEEQLAELKVIRPWLVCIHVFYWTKDENGTRCINLVREGKDVWKQYLDLVWDMQDIHTVLEFCKDDDDDNFCDDIAAMKELVLPRAIFVNENGVPPIDNAYDADARAELRRWVNIGDEVYGSADITAGGFEDVQYMFSTWGMLRLTEEQIKTCLPAAKAVFYGAGSVQAFARPYLNCGVRVFSAWAANGVPVAEVSVSEIILANKGFFQSPAIFKAEGKSGAIAYYKNFPANYHTKVGLIGAGMIGSMVSKMLTSNYDLEVLVFDPFASDEKLASIGARRATLEEIFSQCQTISNHLANNEQTRGMLNYKLFSLMKKNATFINTGRGAQIVEADLIRALQEEPARTAVLDVTFPEPPEADSPFYTMPNVFLTPHLAGSFSSEVARMGAYMVEECVRDMKGIPVRWEVSMEMLATMA
ncbi:MAG: hypothetical protein E7463_04650 [Ruminococcaceae bacterium]|nr:hypothetical protein [Oscillospiraceae bacterium]